MNELIKYVDSLFLNYRKDKNTQDFKEEILSNLEAKWSDYISQGMDEAEALKRVKGSITSIDGLVEDSKLIFSDRFKLERLQVTLMGLMIGWILTIPLMIFQRFNALNISLFLMVIIYGIYYISQTKQNQDSDRISIVYIEGYYRYRKAAWLIWGLFFAVSCILITGIHFASNIWFLRPVHIDGPYQFAMLAIQYYIPFITILIPVTMTRICSILRKNEAGETV